MSGGVIHLQRTMRNRKHCEAGSQVALVWSWSRIHLAFYHSCFLFKQLVINSINDSTSLLITVLGRPVMLSIKI